MSISNLMCEIQRQLILDELVGCDLDTGNQTSVRVGVLNDPVDGWCLVAPPEALQCEHLGGWSMPFQYVLVRNGTGIQCYRRFTHPDILNSWLASQGEPSVNL